MSDASRAGSGPSGSAAYLPVLVFGCAILLLSSGARSSWGLFLPEMNAARGWSRETFSIAIALQNLAWGIGAALLGALADKIGSLRTLLLGATLYVCGLIATAYVTTGGGLSFSAGLIVGVGIAGTGTGVVLAAIGKVVPADKRTWAFGVGSASNSMGQFLFLPATAYWIAELGWQGALFINAVAVALIFALAFGIRGDREAASTVSGSASLTEAFGQAVRDRSFHLLFWGYFVCGLQVMFLALHLPAYLTDKSMPLELGAHAIAIVGLFNVLGSLGAGWLGVRYSRKWLLSGIYVGRSIVMILFLWAPLSVFSVYLFSAAMGLLWLSTVPLTTSLVGHIYGVRYLGMLGGIVFLGHQIGSFLGSWLGGRIFDATGSYDGAWMLVIAFGAFAAVMHAPIDQRPLAQRRPVAATARPA